MKKHSGYICQVDGQASEVRFACLHTMVSRAVLWKKYRRESFDSKFHKEHRDEYLQAASKNNLVKAFGSGMDVHRMGTALIMDKDPKDVTDAERKQGKFVTLGRQYGRGYRAIAAQYELDPDIMKARVEKWDAVFPEFTQDWHPAVRDWVREKGFVTSLYNLVRRIPQIWYEEEEIRVEAERWAINSPVQGDSHMWISNGVSWFHINAIDKYKMRTVVWDDIHDAYLTDTPVEELDRTCIKMAQSMLQPYFDHDKYPWLVCDLATELEIYHPWGHKKLKCLFDTSTMKDKNLPGFSLEDACADVYFNAKKKLID